VVALPPPKALLRVGKHPVRKLKRAQILPAADAGAADQKIAISVGGGRLDRLPNQAPLRLHSAKNRDRGQPQAVGQRGSLAGGHCLFGSARKRYVFVFLKWCP
jgi:hypothetical protein